MKIVCPFTDLSTLETVYENIRLLRNVLCKVSNFISTRVDEAD